MCATWHVLIGPLTTIAGSHHFSCQIFEFSRGSSLAKPSHFLVATWWPLKFKNFPSKIACHPTTGQVGLCSCFVASQKVDVLKTLSHMNTFVFKHLKSPNLGNVGYWFVGFPLLMAWSLLDFVDSKILINYTLFEVCALYLLEKRRRELTYNPLHYQYGQMITFLN